MFQCFKMDHVVSNAAGQVTSNVVSLAVAPNTYVFTTIAGLPTVGSNDGAGSAARFDQPWATAVDGAGNVYVADMRNNTIRKITPDGDVTTLAGTPGVGGHVDGTGSAALLFNPSGVAVDGAGTLYVADTSSCTIRKITTGGVVTTLAGSAYAQGSADGTGSAARFVLPMAVAVDAAGNVYVADEGNDTIRKVAPGGVVTTLAGTAGLQGSADGVGSAARFFNPYGVAADAAGDVYVADTNNQTIRKITPGGVVTTLTGTVAGSGSAAGFSGPGGVAVDAAGNVYVSDSGNDTIREITPGGVVTTLAGTAGISGSLDGTGNAAQFGHTWGISVDGAGNVYVADTGNNSIRKVTSAGVVTTLAGPAGVSRGSDGVGSAARFYNPTASAVDGAGNVYVADRQNFTIRKISTNGAVTTLAGTAGLSGTTDGTGSAARFSYPDCLALDGAGNLYVTDTNNDTIRKITPAGIVTTFAGAPFYFGSADGVGSAARFESPSGIALDAAGNLYVADSLNDTIRKITPAGVVTTLAGTAGASGSADGTGSAARFLYPYGMAVDAAGNVYVADLNNDTIRKITPAGVVTTLAGMARAFGSTDGTGSAARFSNPSGVAVDAGGNVYVADAGNDTLREITPGGVVTTLAGTPGASGSADGQGSAAQFYAPGGVAVDSAGNLYVADTSNCTIRKGTSIFPMIETPPSSLSVFFGSTAAFSVGASGSATLSYQWQLNGVPIPGATEPTYMITNAQPAAAGNYTVIVTNSVGSATSSPAMLTVNPASTPVVTSQPQGQSATAGLPVTFTAAAGGTPAPTYQWYFNGQALLGATNSSFSIASAQVLNSGSYTVVATNAAGSATSSAAMLTVTASSGGPAITAQPAPQTIAMGSTVVFSVNSSGLVQASSSGSSDARRQADASGTSATYQWYLNGVVIQGATYPILVVQATSTSAGTYSCLVSNTNGSVLSNAATLTVSDAPADPGRLINLSTLAVAGGGSQTLTVGFFTGGTGTSGVAEPACPSLGTDLVHHGRERSHARSPVECLFRPDRHRLKHGLGHAPEQPDSR